MIVQRAIFNVKKDCMQEFLELHKKRGYNYRLYQSRLGTFDQISFEWEWENMAAYEKTWADWFALPETPAFLEKVNALIAPGGTNEIWNLIE